MNTQPLKLDLIRTDAGSQIRCVITNDYVEDIAERMLEGDKLPAVDVFYDGHEYILSDGFHRVAACLKNGFLDVLANVMPGGLAEAIENSIEKNSSTGLRLTNADKRSAITKLLKSRPEFSDRQIATKAKVSNHLVAQVRRELGDLPVVAVRTGKDGKTRKVKLKLPSPEVCQSAKTPDLPDDLDERKLRASKPEEDEPNPFVEVDNGQGCEPERMPIESVPLKSLQIVFEESIKPLWMAADKATKKAFIAWLKS